MKKHIYNEQNGLRYTLHGDVYLPDLSLTEKEYPPLGKYGRMRKTYLQEHHKVLYSRMLMDGSLWQHLRDVDEQTRGMVDSIVSSMAEVDGVTEELKATDQMRWVGLMNNYTHCAEELVLREIVYT